MVDELPPPQPEAPGTEPGEELPTVGVESVDDDGPVGIPPRFPEEEPNGTE